MKTIQAITLMMCILTTPIYHSQTPVDGDDYVITKDGKPKNFGLRRRTKSIQLESGFILSVGDTITIGNETGKGSYRFIAQDRSYCSDFTSVSPPSNFHSGLPLGSSALGAKIIIKKIKLTSDYRIEVYATHAHGYINDTRILSINSAIVSGEICGTGYLSSNQARDILNNAKWNKEFGILTEEEYQLIKTEMIKHIR